MRSPFLEALREGLKCAESTDPKWLSVAGYFKPGDADHLRRWLNDKQAATIFAKLSKGKKITQRRIIGHIHGVLVVRRIAEDTDKLNATFAELKKNGPRLAKKEHRRAIRQFADGDVSQEALDDYLGFINEVEALGSNLDSLFVVRSDRDGSRKRTIFCRILSHIFHRAFGRWHDAEVAALCGIAFDCDVSLEAVKEARKSKSFRLRHLAISK